jgi:hypothetical protein
VNFFKWLSKNDPVSEAVRQMVREKPGAGLSDDRTAALNLPEWAARITAGESVEATNFVLTRRLERAIALLDALNIPHDIEMP